MSQYGPALMGFSNIWRYLAMCLVAASAEEARGSVDWSPYQGTTIVSIP